MSDNLTSKQTPDKVEETTAGGLVARSQIVEGGCYQQAPLPPADLEKVPPASEEIQVPWVLIALLGFIGVALVWRYVVR